MIRECRHIMPTGRRCHSPAMHHSAYCYHHARLHGCPGAPRPIKRSVKIPKIDSREALLAGLTDVMNAMLSRKIDCRQGGRLIYGLQVAASSLTRLGALGKLLPAAQEPASLDAPGPSAATQQLAEKLGALKGHGFSRAVKGTESARPSGPGGLSSRIP